MKAVRFRGLNTPICNCPLGPNSGQGGTSVLSFKSHTTLTVFGQIVGLKYPVFGLKCLKYPVFGLKCLNPTRYLRVKTIKINILTPGPSGVSFVFYLFIQEGSGYFIRCGRLGVISLSLSDFLTYIPGAMIYGKYRYFPSGCWGYGRFY